tara:strand:+ start:2077 stop:3375 length:1299 start_codon:yes stop_codon:yes gene_type:complete
MSISGALASGVSGLQVNSSALGAIADNISNSNTVGYKRTESRFSTLVTQQVSGTQYSPGGVQDNVQREIGTQGLLSSSTSSLDTGISGQGFFVATQTATAATSDTHYYTRAGNWKADDDGFLKNTSGFYLRAWPTDSTGNVVNSTGTVIGTPSESTFTELTSVNINSLQGTATPTANLGLSVNLPASAATGAANSVNTSVVVFDSLGDTHQLTFNWEKTAALTWDVTVTIDDGGATVGAAYNGTPMTVVFNTDGTPATFEGAATPPALAITGLTNAADDFSITLDLGTASSADGITQVAAPYITNSVEQDGRSFGSLSGLSFDQSGFLNATFDNGTSRPIFKVPLATFVNPDGMESRSGNVFIETAESGTFLLRAAQTGGSGSVEGGTLEQSTVDIAEEFTRMIVVQRAFSANTKTIQTADEMLEELVRLKR